MKEEALKDVLEDSDSEDERTSCATSTTPKEKGSAEIAISDNQSPKVLSASAQRFSQPSAQSAAAGRTSESTTPTQGACKADKKQRDQTCFVAMLPPDLLLQCAEFLGDGKALCRVREVSLGWLLALDDREAGRRLWRPLFYRLRASGSIHAATDARGQRRHQLKVYDLGTSTPTSAGHFAAVVPGEGTSMSTPSRTQRTSSGGSATIRSPSAADLASNAGSSGGAPRRSSSCLVCGLIQREGYRGKDCEMCASSLVLAQSNVYPATPRVAYTRVNLSGGAGSSTTSPPGGTPVAEAALPSLKASGAAGSPCLPYENTSVSGARDVGRTSALPRGDGVVGSESGEDERGVSGGRDVDWHFLVKRLTEEKRTAAGWGSLHQGWVWLHREFQVSSTSRRGKVVPLLGFHCESQGRLPSLRTE